MRVWLALLLLLSTPALAAAPCARPWLFFDTGNVLVDTADFEHMKYTPDAKAYLAEARRQRYRLGLIVNIPQEWGKHRREKMTALKKFIHDGWTAGEPDFDWNPFSIIFIPRDDTERKPSPVMFERALKRARADGCEALYQGEDQAEVDAAEHAGMHVYTVGLPGRSFFFPLEHVRNAIDRAAQQRKHPRQR